MSVHLQHQFSRLKKHLLSLGAMVEDQVETAVRALMDRDEELARQVEARDAEIDHREVEVEEECLKTLALYQPVANDLRFVVAAMKINNDLERIGDLAVNIARKVIHVAGEERVEIPFDLPGMWQKTQGMLRDSIDALVNLDGPLANTVCTRDSEVDQMKRDNRRKAETILQEDPRRAPVILNLMAVSRNLERIADHATNIAEGVIFMVNARVVKHHAYCKPEDI